MQPTFEIKEEKDGNYAKFVISPLAAGYGDTLGVTLRRVLLTSLPGAAITSVRIAGVKHQFSTLKGMKEDVLDFLLNLKKVRIAIDDNKPVKLSLSAKDAGEVKAGDIKTPGNARIANPELVLSTLSKGAKLEVDMDVETGVGYLPAEERSSEKIGVILLDATFSPVTRVNYKVEETRVGRVTNYDRLTLEVWTDGTISPSEALVEASKIAVSYFNQIISPKAPEAKAEVQTSGSDLGAVGKLSIEEVGVPTRVANALIKAGFDTVEKLVNAPREELLKVRNLGEKSLKVVRAALAEKGVELKNA